MAEGIVSRAFRFRVLFVVLALFIMFVQLLPLGAGPGGLPGPDWLLIFGCAFALRRPDYIPLMLAAVIYLMADVLFLRPLGLWAAICVLGLEFLRSREASARDLPFPAEWAMVIGLIVVMNLAYALILMFFGVDQPTLGLSLIQMIATVLAYPLVVVFCSKLLGIRKMSPGEVDQFGHRL